MPYRRSKSKHIYIERELLRSDAFKALSKSSTNILLLFYMRRKMSKLNRKNRTEWIIENNGQIVFTYLEAENLGYTRATFLRSIDQLIELGFISVARTGAGVARSATLYSIDERWKDYGTDRFVERKRPRKSRWSGKRIGFQKGHPHYSSNKKNIRER